MTAVVRLASSAAIRANRERLEKIDAAVAELLAAGGKLERLTRDGGGFCHWCCSFHGSFSTLGSKACAAYDFLSALSPEPAP